MQRLLLTTVFQPTILLALALMAVIGYFLLSIHTFLAAKVVGEFRLSYLSGGPTELRLMLMAMTAAMPIVGTRDIGGLNLTILDLFALGIASILMTLFVVQSFATARMLARRDG